MKRAALAVLPLVGVLAVAPLSGRAASSQPLEKPFARAGKVNLRLVAGEYRITGRPDDRIRVDWRTERPEQATRVRADVRVEGTTAFITTDGPKNSGLRFTIELPARTDLDVYLSAGDLDVRGLEGSKTIESWAGDISVEVGRPEQYRTVEASVRAGDLRARPFSKTTGGLFRSLKWSGAGIYALRVKLFAGDLTLE